MISDVELSPSYRSSRKWVMLISWIGILWATSVLNITKINLPYINEILISGQTIPLIILSCLIFSIILMHIEYAMMAIRTRRNALAIFDFKLFLYLSKLAIASLAVSVEVREVKAIFYFTASFLPVMFGIFVMGVFIGFILILVATRFRKHSRGFASWVIAMFSLGNLLAAFLAIFSIVLVALGLTFFDEVKDYFDIQPTVIGIWSITTVAIILILQQYFESAYTNILFGFEYYNPKTNVKKYFNKNGQLTQVVQNYKKNSIKNALNLTRTP